MYINELAVASLEIPIEFFADIESSPL